MNTPTVSIVVPVYRAEKYLDACLRSIVRQSYRQLEIILVDDGSPDTSGAICDAWAAKDRRIRVIHQANGGVSTARNTGIATASGVYIQFVDCDDRIDRRMVHTLVRQMEQQHADIVFCGMRVVEMKNDRVLSSHAMTNPALGRHCVLDRTAFLQKLPWIYRHVGNMEGPCSRMYRLSIIRQNALRFPLDKRIGEDHLFNLSYYPHCQKVVFISKLLYDYIRRDVQTLTTTLLPDLYENQMQQMDALQSMLDANVTLSAQQQLHLDWYRSVYIYYVIKNTLTAFMQKPENQPDPLAALLQKTGLQTAFFAVDTGHEYSRQFAPYIQSADADGLRSEYVSILQQLEKDRRYPFTFFLVRHLRSYADAHPTTRLGKTARVLQLNLATVGLKETVSRIAGKLSAHRQ